MAEQIDYQLGGAFLPDRPVRFGKQVRFETGPVNVLDRVEFNAEVSGDGRQLFVEVAGTLPANPNATITGVSTVIKSSGAANFGQLASSTFLDPGYSGNQITAAAYLTNGAAGSASSPLTFAANYGSYNESYGGGSGTNVASFADGYGGSGKNYGVLARGYDGAAGIGVAGLSGGGTIRVGGFFGLINSEPTYESAAALADNGATTSPIILARDNGVAVWSVQDGGSLQGKMGAKTLTEGAATGFVRVSVPSGTTVGGFVKYSIEANDGIDFQVRTGILPFGAVNKAGTETGAVATVSTATETVAVSAGTLTNTFDVDTTPANAIDIRANATSSLTQTTLRINFSVELYGNAVVTVTPL